MLALVALVLAACGGGGTPATTTAGGAGATQAAGGGGGGATPAPAATQASGDGGGGGGGELADQCSLLTADEVGAAYNQTGVKPTQVDGGYSAKVCDYLPSKGGNIPMLEVAVEKLDSRPCEKYRTNVGVDVPGLGDWAYWKDDSAELFVKVGERCLVLGDHFNTLEDTKATLTELATKALARL
jgi:hypothetical protein